jgi:hypothetical protein
MPEELRIPTVAPRTVATEAGKFTVTAPRWGDWQAALDRACPGGQPDAGRLVEECLLTCIRKDGGADPVSREALQTLSARDGDRLLAAALEMIDWQRQALDLQVLEQPGGLEIRGTGVQLRLRPWSFGERNEALRSALRLEGERVMLDLMVYEQAMVRRCVASTAGEADAAPAVRRSWPVPLGDLVMRELDRLNGLDPAYAETLAACIRSGQEHPDLALIQLCRAFGWSPEEAERMGASTAQRLVAALQVVQGAADAASLSSVPSQGEGVTRIIVEDD